MIWLLDLHGGQRVDSVLVRSNLTPPLHTIPPFVTRTPLIFQRNTKSLWQSSRTKGLRRILFLAIFQTDSKSRHLFKQKERQGIPDVLFLHSSSLLRVCHFFPDFKPAHQPLQELRLARQLLARRRALYHARNLVDAQRHLGNGRRLLLRRF